MTDDLIQELQEKIFLHDSTLELQKNARQTVNAIRGNLESQIKFLQDDAAKFNISITLVGPPNPSFTAQEASRMAGKIFNVHQHGISLEDNQTRLKVHEAKAELLRIEIIEILNQLNLPVELADDGEMT